MKDLEFLELRERLKESIRMRKGSDSVVSNKKLSYDNYGSFFGPSKTIIAQRVIQECSKKLLENQHQQQPKVVNQIKVKALILKDSRDYSFLLSDDAAAAATLPAAPTKAPPTRKVSIQKQPLKQKKEYQEPSSQGKIKPKQLVESSKPKMMNKQISSRSSLQEDLSIQKQPLKQKKEYQEPSSQGKIKPKQLVESSKPKMMNKQISSRSSLQEDRRPKKKAARRCSDEQAIDMIRQMFPRRYNHNHDDDDDDSDMEANFNDIMEEEKRSSRIAKREDEIELQRIKEEESREKMLKKEAKTRRKLSQ